jgi:hypothetical protein
MAWHRSPYVVNDLIDRKAPLHQLAPVQRRGGAHLRQYRPATGRTGNLAAAHGVGGLLDLERPDQLIEKQRHAVCELSFGHSGCEPSRNLETAAFYYIGAIAAEELMEHLRRLR